MRCTELQRTYVEGICTSGYYPSLVFQDPANGCFEIDIKPNLKTDMKPNLSISGDGIHVPQQMEECSTVGKK